jgi:hypothetical protein
MKFPRGFGAERAQKCLNAFRRNNILNGSVE